MSTSISLARLSLSRPLRQTYKDFCALTKPGLVTFVVLSVYISYAFATQHLGEPGTLWPLLFGTYLAGSGAHIFNQLLERKSDAAMARTRLRPLARGAWSPFFALWLGVAFSGLGVGLHYYNFGWLTASITLGTILLYLFAYTPAKTRTIWNTWVGAVPGAMPALTGYSSTWHELPLEAFLFPLLVFFWQIPHFLALAYKYKKDYAQAGLKMFPGLDKTGRSTGLLMGIHALMLVEISVLPYFCGLMSGITTLFAMAVGFWFVWKIFRFWQKPEPLAGGLVFMASNFYLLLLYGLILADPLTIRLFESSRTPLTLFFGFQ